MQWERVIRFRIRTFIIRMFIYSCVIANRPFDLLRENFIHIFIYRTIVHTTVYTFYKLIHSTFKCFGETSSAHNYICRIEWNIHIEFGWAWELLVMGDGLGWDADGVHRFSIQIHIQLHVASFCFTVTHSSRYSSTQFCLPMNWKRVCTRSYSPQTLIYTNSI